MKCVRSCVGVFYFLLGESEGGGVSTREMERKKKSEMTSREIGGCVPHSNRIRLARNRGVPLFAPPAVFAWQHPGPQKKSQKQRN